MCESSGPGARLSPLFPRWNVKQPAEAESPIQQPPPGHNNQEKPAAQAPLQMLGSKAACQRLEVV